MTTSGVVAPQRDRAFSRAELVTANLVILCHTELAAAHHVDLRRVELIAFHRTELFALHWPTCLPRSRPDPTRLRPDLATSLSSSPPRFPDRREERGEAVRSARAHTHTHRERRGNAARDGRGDAAADGERSGRGGIGASVASGHLLASVGKRRWGRDESGRRREEKIKNSMSSST